MENEAEKFLQQYIHFCRSTMRTANEIKRDLGRLLSLPMVKQVTFANPSVIKHTIIVGLKPLVLKNPRTGRRHFIGHFVAYLSREHRNPEWYANFELVNLTPLRHTTEENYNGIPYQSTNHYHHPHMTEETHEDLGPIAYICISRGKPPIYRYIREGRLDHAVELITNLLQTLGPNQPFCDIKHWPQPSKQRKTR